MDNSRIFRQVSKVIVVTASTAVYGAELLMLRNAAPLEKRGASICFAGPANGSVPDMAKDFGVDYIPIDLVVAQGIRNSDGESRPSLRALVGELATTIRNAWRIRRALPSNAILHSNSGSIHLSVVLAARSRRQPVVVHLHDLVRPGLGRKILGAIVRLSDCAVAISEAVKDCVPARFHDRVRLVPNGVDTTPTKPNTDIRAELGLAPESLLVAYVARFHPNKRQHLLLEAWPHVISRVPEAHLILIGGHDPSMAWYHDQIVDEAKSIQKVSVLGRRNDVRSLLSQTDLLAHPAKAEPFGLGIVEAMAEGCSVLVSRSGGAVEVIVDGESGRTFEPGDAEDAGEKVVELLLDAPQRRRLAVVGQQRAVAEFGIDQHADRLAEIYRTLIA